jgi:TonB family protein
MIRKSLLAGAVAVAMWTSAAQAEDDLFSRMMVMAQSGDSWAQYMIGKAYLNGADFAGTPPRHVAQDLEQAELWLTRAAGQEEYNAAVALARAYDEGPLPRDVNKAIRWYKDVTEYTDDSDDNDMHLANGRLCTLVMGATVHDPEAAEPYCAYMARHGKPEGYFGVGKAYEAGDGVEASSLKALDIYRELADTYGYRPAIERLAFSYRDGGRLTGRDDAEALHWILRLAEVAPETYLIEVARRLEKGVGAPAHPEDAGRYYLAAAKAGNAEAGAWLAKHPSVTAAEVERIAVKDMKGGLNVTDVDADGKNSYDYYPAHAKDNEIEGSATVNCRVTAKGKLERCLVVAEGPDGEGFGAATLLVMRRYVWVKPEAVARLSGKLVRIVYKWQLDK